MGVCYIVCAAEMSADRFSPGEGDYIIAADAGIRHLQRLNVWPDLIVGDFDSLGHIPAFPDVEVCPVEKDDTDSMIAIRRALDMGYTELRLFGALGGARLDHTLANVQSIAYARAHGAAAYLFGMGCALTAISGEALEFDARYSGDVSVFCHGANALGVHESGLHYSLDGAELTAFFPLGVSNSFTGSAAEISVEDGTLIVYWSDNAALPLPRRRALQKKQDAI